VSNWLDQQKDADLHWVVVREWDNDNTLTYLFWMTPALSLFINFDNNRQNILLAQALLYDKSLNSHVWMFKELVKATNIHSAVILTDADPAIDVAI
ncbi:17469_t:CDS:2, partial [Funneliformis geosporum]